MIFDWTVSLGNLISLVGFIGVGLSMFYGMRADIRLLNARIVNVEGDLNKIDQTLQQIVKVFVEVARQDERMSSMDRRMNDLSNRLLACERALRVIPGHQNPALDTD